jgi:hypothetical protein
MTVYFSHKSLIMREMGGRGFEPLKAYASRFTDQRVTETLDSSAKLMPNVGSYENQNDRSQSA